MEKSDGIPVTEEMIRAWADEAERGYDVDVLRKLGRKPQGDGPARVVPVRLDESAARLARMEKWSGVSEAYRQSFATLCAGTIGEVLDSLPDGRLADVGCGTGDLLRSALERGWDAVGIDADPDMVAMASEAAPGRVVDGALPDLPVSAREFDSVAANFVLNHVGDPRAGIRELARITRAGGTVAATIWPAGGAGWSTLVGATFEAAHIVPIPSTRLPEHLDFPRTTVGLAGLAEQAGLQVTAAREISWTWQVAPDALWAGISGGVATPGQTYLAQTPETQDRVRHEFVERTREEAQNGLLQFANRAVLVVAEKV